VVETSNELDAATLLVVKHVFDESAATLRRDHKIQEYKVILASRILSLAAGGLRDPAGLRVAAVAIASGLNARTSVERRPRAA
jgi:hypothetical protein